MPFTGFPPEAITLLHDIIAHNDKEWFEDNKERYLRHSEALIDRLFKHHETLLPLQQWVYHMTMHTPKEEHDDVF